MRERVLTLLRKQDGRHQRLMLFKVLILLFLPVVSMAEASSIDGLRPQIAVGYYGDRIRNPGLSVDLGLPVAADDLSVLSLDARFSGYVSPRNDASAFTDVSLLYRMTFGFGLFWDVSIGAGIAWLIPLTTEYPNDAGSMTIPATGKVYGSMPIGLGLGWDFSRNGLSPLSVFCRVELFGRYPDFETILLSYAIRAGVRIPL